MEKNPQNKGRLLLIPSPVGDNAPSDFKWDQGDDFQLVWGPQQGRSTSIQNINGKRTKSSQFTFTYILVPKKTGTFSLPKATADQMILTMSIDADNDAATGLANGSMGVEWLLEGNFWSGGWASWYDSSSGENVEDPAKAESYVQGTYLAENDRMQLEFAMSRKDFDMTGSSITMSMKFYNEDWNNAIMISCDGKEAFPVAMDKTE